MRQTKEKLFSILESNENLERIVNMYMEMHKINIESYKIIGQQTAETFFECEIPDTCHGKPGIVIETDGILYFLDPLWPHNPKGMRYPA